MSQKSDERRGHQRKALATRVRVQTPDGGSYELDTSNLSDGGAFVQGDTLLPTCTVCTIAPLESEGLRLEATVVHTRETDGGFGMGLWFSDLSPEDQSSLQQWLHLSPSDAGEPDPDVT